MREYIVPIANTDRDGDEMFIGFIRKREELIRCEDCKNCIRTEYELICRKIGMTTKPEGYCDVGRRK